MLRHLARTLVLLAALLLAGPAHSHLLNMTELSLQVQPDGASELVVRIDLGQSLMSAEAYWRAVNAEADEQRRLIADAVGQLEQGVQVHVGVERRPLVLREWALAAVSESAIRNPLTPQMATLVFTVAAGDDERVEIKLAEGLTVPWPCLLRVDIPGAETPVSRLLTNDTRSSRSIRLDTSPQDAGRSVWINLASGFQSWVPGVTWVAVGFQHIIPLGLDHIVFVLGLFFLSTKFSTLLWQVSCFTLAHSLTLALASAGLISVSAELIEPLIAASIVYVAIDNLHGDRIARWRLPVITSFGLLHGLGFASALSAIQLPADGFLSSLLLFNLGVELGQLTVLVVAFLAVGWLRRWPGYGAKVARPATLTIAGVGAYWLVKRVAL